MMQLVCKPLRILGKAPFEQRSHDAGLTVESRLNSYECRYVSLCFLCVISPFFFLFFVIATFIGSESQLFVQHL